jgi:hypothetical protein
MTSQRFLARLTGIKSEFLGREYTAGHVLYSVLFILFRYGVRITRGSVWEKGYGIITLLRKIVVRVVVSG